MCADVPEYEVVANALKDMQDQVHRFELLQKKYAKLHKAVVDSNNGSSDTTINPKHLNELTRM
jgi:hypothetical protein